MSHSPDLIANIIFGVIMIVIGIATLWAVRWQAFFLLRHHSKVLDSQHVSHHTNILLLDHIKDEEQAFRLSRTNSDASADDTNILAPRPESAAEDQPASVGVTSQLPRSDTDVTAISISVLDQSTSAILEAKGL
jgi:hypothetical protein